MTWENRIVRHGEEDPRLLLERVNPLNWRAHSLTQAQALDAALVRVGWVQHVIVNEQTGHLVDGHLRVERAVATGQQSIPVVFVSLSEEEEAEVLATLDPLASMALTDRVKLDILLRDMQAESEPIQRLLREMAQKANLYYQQVIEAAQWSDSDVESTQEELEHHFEQLEEYDLLHCPCCGAPFYVRKADLKAW